MRTIAERERQAEEWRRRQAQDARLNRSAALRLILDELKWRAIDPDDDDAMEDWEDDWEPVRDRDLQGVVAVLVDILIDKAGADLETQVQRELEALGPVSRPLVTPAREFVYYAEREGFVKIGTSTDIAARLRFLAQGGCVVPDGMRFGELTLLASQPGGVATEHELHRRFASARVAGEWFTKTPELLAHIASLPQEPERVSA